MNEIEVNLNAKIRVKLTASAIKLIKDHFKQFKNITIPDKYFPDRLGYSEFQLYDFMHIFGEHLYPGCQTVANENRLFIQDMYKIVDTKQC